MGWTIQINPTSPAFLISVRLAEGLKRYTTEYELLYAFVSKPKPALKFLREFVPQGREDAAVVEQLIVLLEAGEPVEVLMGF